MIKALFSGILIAFMFLESFSTLEVLAAPDPFPTYKRLEPNVAFWSKIFDKSMMHLISYKAEHTSYH